MAIMMEGGPKIFGSFQGHHVILGRYGDSGTVGSEVTVRIRNHTGLILDLVRLKPDLPFRDDLSDLTPVFSPNAGPLPRFIVRSNLPQVARCVLSPDVCDQLVRELPQAYLHIQGDEIRYREPRTLDNPARMAAVIGVLIAIAVRIENHNLNG